MIRDVKDRVWAFDCEWIPDPLSGRLLYEVPAAVTSPREIMEVMWERGGATEADPTPFLKTVLCRIVSIACVERRVKDDGGVVLFITSVSGMRPSPGTAAYGAAKAGLISLTQSLAVEWAPKVRVAAVSAGMVRTEQSHLHYGDEAGIAAVGETVPLGRIADPDDIGDACLYLASPLARYVSGSTLLVHGGGEKPAFLAAAKPASG